VWHLSERDVEVGHIVAILQRNRLHWLSHVLSKDDEWVKKCIDYEVKGTR